MKNTAQSRIFSFPFLNCHQKNIIFSQSQNLIFFHTLKGILGIISQIKCFFSLNFNFKRVISLRYYIPKISQKKEQMMDNQSNKQKIPDYFDEIRQAKQPKKGRAAFIASIITALSIAIIGYTVAEVQRPLVEKVAIIDPSPAFSASYDQTTEIVKELRYKLQHANRELHEYKKELFNLHHPRDLAKISILEKNLAQKETENTTLDKAIQMLQSEVRFQETKNSQAEIVLDALAAQLKKERMTSTELASLYDNLETADLILKLNEKELLVLENLKNQLIRSQEEREVLGLAQNARETELLQEKMSHFHAEKIHSLNLLLSYEQLITSLNQQLESGSASRHEIVNFQRKLQELQADLNQEKILSDELLNNKIELAFRLDELQSELDSKADHESTMLVTLAQLEKSFQEEKKLTQKAHANLMQQTENLADQLTQKIESEKLLETQISQLETSLAILNAEKKEFSEGINLTKLEAEKQLEELQNLILQDSLQKGSLLVQVEELQETLAVEKNKFQEQLDQLQQSLALEEERNEKLFAESTETKKEFEKKFELLASDLRQHSINEKTLAENLELLEKDLTLEKAKQQQLNQEYAENKLEWSKKIESLETQLGQSSQQEQSARQQNVSSEKDAMTQLRDFARELQQLISTILGV